jgi:hypothetical protein
MAKICLRNQRLIITHLHTHCLRFHSQMWSFNQLLNCEFTMQWVCQFSHNMWIFKPSPFVLLQFLPHFLVILLFITICEFFTIILIPFFLGSFQHSNQYSISSFHVLINRVFHLHNLCLILPHNATLEKYPENQ